MDELIICATFERWRTRRGGQPGEYIARLAPAERAALAQLTADDLQVRDDVIKQWF